MKQFFFFISAKSTNFEVSSLSHKFQVSSLGLGIFDEVSVLIGIEVLTRSQSRRLRSWLHDCFISPHLALGAIWFWDPGAEHWRHCLKKSWCCLLSRKNIIIAALDNDWRWKSADYTVFSKNAETGPRPEHSRSGKFYPNLCRLLLSISYISFK